MSIVLAAGLLEGLGLNLKVLGVQVVLFLTTFFILSRILFGRVLSHLQRREEEVRSQEEALVREREELERLAKEHEAHVAKVEKEAYDRMQAILKEGLSAGEQILAQAQKEAQSQIEGTRKAITEERTRAAEQLREEVLRLTTQACSKILNVRLEETEIRSVIREVLSEER